MISSLYDTIRLLFRKDKKPYFVLKDILGFYPRNIELYRLALRHKSAVPQEKSKDRSVDKSINNERLEFLGDAILGAVVADILYKRYGRRQEGFLTNLRSKIVCRKSLGVLAEKIGLDRLILHSSVRQSSHNSYMNGNAFEAFFGAIYLDRGYDYCHRFVEDVIMKDFINVDQLSKEDENHKSALIEWCQKYQFKVQFVNQEGREGNVPKFHCVVKVEGVVCGEGEGYSKKEGDQAAAKCALKNLNKDKALKSKIQKTKAELEKASKEQSIHDKALAKLKGRKTLIFDLDGTLMDTLMDLYLSTNYALKESGFQERSLDEVRRYVGNGIGQLIERALFADDKDCTDNKPQDWEETYEHCLSVFKRHYVEHCQDNTGLYPGIKELLAELKQKEYRIAIVSNKLQSGVTELYDVWFRDTVDVAIGESDGVSRKPAPDMVLKALEALGSEKSDAVYIGDSDVDIETAKNSELPCISVLWGFRTKQFLKEHGAVLMVETPEEIVSLL